MNPQSLSTQMFHLLFARFVFGLNFFWAFLFFYPQHLKTEAVTGAADRWASMALPFLKWMWNSHISDYWLWTPLALGSLALAFGLCEVTLSIVLGLIWLFELHFMVLRSNPAAFLVLFTFCFLLVRKKSPTIQISYKTFWALFLFTIGFDLLNVANTALDLFPFGLKHEHTFLPSKLWINLTLACDLLFLILMAVRPARVWAWVILWTYHLMGQGLNGYSDYSTSIMVSMLFLFNPQWTTEPSDPQLKPYIFYDGACALCDRFIQFLLVEDFGRHFYFAPLQGPTAKEKLKRQDPSEIQSIVFLDEGKTYYRLDAIIKILAQVGGFWVLAQLLWLIPKPLRDGIYNWVAVNRYGWFGTIKQCRLPSADEKQYFRN